ncbi:MAG: hypothetical protein R6X21_06970, partial [Candidatus Aminicenantes bacterium]
FELYLDKRGKGVDIDNTSVGLPTQFAGHALSPKGLCGLPQRPASGAGRNAGNTKQGIRLEAKPDCVALPLIPA